jgi:FO synthase
MCRLVIAETGLIPHVNAGVMDAGDIARLRKVSASQGLMLETVADRLGDKGGPHYRSPDKVPAARLATIRAAGELKVPFTTGILIGSVRAAPNGSTPCWRSASCTPSTAISPK